MKDTQRRILSASSLTSNESLSSINFSGKTIKELFPLQEDLEYVYNSTLKILLLEYINEPRFRRRWKKTPNQDTDNKERTSDSRGKNREHAHRRVSTWLGNDEEGALFSRDTTIDVILPKLEARLSSIALNQVKISDLILRRSVLKFYNDVFLDPQFAQFVKTLGKSEELIMLFVKSANNEITKLNIEDPKKHLFNQVNYFINLLISLSTGMPNHEEFTKNLRSYMESFEAKTMIGRSKDDRAQLSDQTRRVDVTVNPSFRFNEVSHVKVLCTLFGFDELKVQQDIISLSSMVKNNLYEEELTKQRLLLNKDQGLMVPSNFVNKEGYIEWKNWTLKNIDENCDKMREGSAGHNQSKRQHQNSSIIPERAHEVLRTICLRVLESEFCDDFTSFSSDARFLISKCAKYWLLDYPSSFASIIVSSMVPYMNKKIEEHNLDCALSVIKFIFTYMDSQIFPDEFEIDATLWNQLDKTQWYITLHEIFFGCISCLQQRIKKVFDEIKPNFTPITSVINSVVESDPLMTKLDFRGSDSFRKAIKKIRKQLFKASEAHYIELVKRIPTNEEIHMCHIYELSEKILTDIQELQKVYTKPLLNCLSIPKEVATILLSALFTDLHVMLSRVEKYNNNPIPDAINAYKSLSELRNVYHQVKGEPNINLESHFIRYIENFCDETKTRIVNGIENAFLKESWEPIDPSKEKLYSNSVVDIFKMINESLKMFECLNWRNKIQIFQMYTKIFKSSSDGILMYVQKLISCIEQDLAICQDEQNQENEEYAEMKREEINNSFSEEEKRSKAWFFSEMKNVLKSKSTMDLPKPFLFKKRTCICLNNLNSMLELLEVLEERFDTREISELLSNQFLENGKPVESRMEIIYTLRIVSAEDFSLPESCSDETTTSISFLDTRNGHEVYRTKDVSYYTNPTWNEEFQLHLKPGKKNTVNLMVWYHKNRKNSALNHIRNLTSKSYDSHKVYGKCYLDLHEKLYQPNGSFKSTILELDTSGRIHLQVSLELDKNDAAFAVTRAKRSLSRAISRGIHLIAEKFTPFIHYTISTQTLFNICPRKSSIRPSDDTIYDSLLPLFDYLNSNLAILATDLSHSLLIQIMLEIWLIILNRVDNLILPKLSRMHAHKSPLSSLQIQIVFQWLDALCIDFFHNDGQGPSLQKLKNHQYHCLLLITQYYDFSTEQLMNLVSNYNSDNKTKTDVACTENEKDTWLRILLSRGHAEFVRTYLLRRRHEARDSYARRAIFTHTI